MSEGVLPCERWSQTSCQALGSRHLDSLALPQGGSHAVGCLRLYTNHPATWLTGLFSRKVTRYAQREVWVNRGVFHNFEHNGTNMLQELWNRPFFKILFRLEWPTSELLWRGINWFNGVGNYHALFFLHMEVWCEGVFDPKRFRQAYCWEYKSIEKVPRRLFLPRLLNNFAQG